jgi:hypothetical protein
LCPDNDHPHQLIASKRAELAINTWGSYLFPLVDESEVRLKGIRNMPNYQEGISRSNYYGITGRIDVISSVSIQNAPAGNLIMDYINQNHEIQSRINELTTPEYELIIDYKGMRRPPQDDENNPTWHHHEWQIMTYAWLRSRQAESRPIVGGILFYFDELFPSKQELKILKSEIGRSQTDIIPVDQDLLAVRNWTSKDSAPSLTTAFKVNRSIRIIPINNDNIIRSLGNFDDVIRDIENSVVSESSGRPIRDCWQTNPVERTCTACDFKTYCPDQSRRYSPTVP